MTPINPYSIDLTLMSGRSACAFLLMARCYNHFLLHPEDANERPQKRWTGSVSIFSGYRS